MNTKRDARCRLWAVTLRIIAVLFLGLFATAEAAQMTVVWEPSKDSDVVGYRVHYGTTSKTYNKTVDVGNTTTSTVTNLTADTSYYFVVTAYNRHQLESQPSAEASKSTVVEKMQVTLAWDRSTETTVAGYRLHYGTSSGRYDKQVDVGNTTTATVADLNPDSSYFFAVTAYTAAKLESLPSNEVTVQPRSATAARSLNSTDTATSTAGTAATTLAAATATSEPNRLALKAAAAPSSAPADGAKTGDAPASEEAIATAVPGKYIGVVTSSTPSPENAGAINLNTTAAGKFTGRLTYGGKNYGLKGVFDAAGVASVSVPRAGTSPLAVKLQVKAGNSAGELSGTISEGTAVSEIVGDRAAAATEASAAAGGWTVLCPAADSTSASTNAPQGTGYATIQISRNGAARIGGTLADGTVFSRGTSVSKNNFLYVYVPLYQNRGVLAGVLELKSNAETGGAVTGTVQWIKPAGVAAQGLYPEGFQLDLTASGENYRKPAAAQPGAGFPGTNGISTITLSGGDLVQPISRTLSISAAGKVSVSDPGTERLKIAVNVAAGTFSGSFLDVDARKWRRFSGAVLQTQAIGAGSFQGAKESGSVTLTPKK